MRKWIVYGFYSNPFYSDDNDDGYDSVIVSAENEEAAIEAAQDIAGPDFYATHSHEKPQN